MASITTKEQLRWLTKMFGGDESVLCLACGKRFKNEASMMKHKHKVIKVLRKVKD